MNVEHLLSGISLNTTSINLEFRMIEDIQPYLSLLAKFPKLKSLNLHGNNLSNLSDDLSCLIIEELDITQNPITDLPLLIRQLQTLPKLSRLSITCHNEAFLIDQLPQLRFLNNRELHQVSFKQKDLEKVAIQYDQIRELFRELAPEKDQDMQRLFDEHVRNIIRDFQLRQGKELSLKHNKAYLLRARYALQELCFTHVIQYVGLHSQGLQEILIQIHDDHAQLFKELCALILQQEEMNPVSGFAERVEKQELAIKQLEAEMQEQQQTIELLQEENKKYLDIIIRHGKMDKYNLYVNNDQQVQLKDKINTQYQQQQQQQQQYCDIPQINSAKLISLKQLKDIINDIYESKLRYDQKCQENKMARETMEQHMYTYLNCKYGLKNLIIEQASTIIASIKKYQSEDNDVGVFGKILRNECDEEFRFVQMQVKQTISELLRMFLRQKNPMKNCNDIKEMWNYRQQNGISIEEANEIILYMYNAEDSHNLLNKLPQRKLEYNTFLQYVLEFQMQTHEKYLHRFVKLFKQVDIEKKGILNENQFIQLMQQTNLNLANEQLQRFLLILDPFNLDSFTFSSLVTLLSSEQPNSLSLLQRMSQ